MALPCRLHLNADALAAADALITAQHDLVTEWRTQCRTYRAMAFAALDQLHEAQQTIARQQRQIAEMREERERYARSIFNQ